LTGYTFLQRPHSCATFSSESLSTAAIPPGFRSAASFMKRPRQQTSEKPSSGEKTPAKVSAAISPSEKPATAAGRIPAPRRAWAAAKSTQ
jgi:hypothetical protein